MAKTLAKRAMTVSLKNFMEAVRSKFKINESSCQMEAYVNLKHLKRGGDRNQILLAGGAFNGVNVPYEVSRRTFVSKSRKVSDS